MTAKTAFFAIVVSLFAASTLCGVVAAAAETETRTYVITRDGAKIGTLKSKITRDGDTVTFEADTDIDVEKLDITLYHRSNRFQSVWHGNELESFSSHTIAPGKDDRVKGLRHSGGFEIKGPNGTAVAPEHSFPDTYWNIKTVNAKHLIDKTNGNINRVTISQVQPKELTIGGKKIKAQHYLMTGANNQSLYYDDNGLWLGTAFRHSDGSRIEIVLE